MNTYKAIRKGMRTHVELLAHLRHWTVTHTMGFGSAWSHALDRLEASGMVSFKNGRYVARKGARPVTGAVRA